MYWMMSVLVVLMVLSLPMDVFAQTSQEIDQMCQILALFGLCEISNSFDPNSSSYYAKIENGTVTSVIVSSYNFVVTQPGIWVQTFVDGSQRNEYAKLGGTYDDINDVFISPKPTENAVLNQTSYKWIIPPIIDTSVNGTG